MVLSNEIRGRNAQNIRHVLYNQITNMKTIKLKNTLTNRTVEFKPYAIGEIPPSFDKHKSLHFKKHGLTYIEKVDSFWNYI